MSEGYIIGGGGSDLNFKVIAVASESALPTSAAENTIAVITTTPITSYVFSSTAPTSPTEGMVWALTDKSSIAAFNAIRRNGLWVYPLSCQQYISGAWIEKNAKSYLNGAWSDWWDGSYYKPGNQEIFITGGWQKFAKNSGVNRVTFYPSEIHFGVQYQPDPGYGGIICTNNKIDVTNLSSLNIRKACQPPTTDVANIPNAGFGLLSNATYVSPSSSSGWVAMAVIYYTQSYGANKVYSTSRLDISGLSGSYYIAIGNEWPADYNHYGGSEMWVPRIWGENL
jgi:hypothetical protein|nr:MAG TPA_asm: hypothetical protein [Caudoviricetes sp.]